MASDVTIERVVKSEAFRRDGVVVVADRVSSFVLKLTGPDGRMVTVGFDGRYDISKVDGSCELYGLYRDCPVVADMPGDANRRDSGSCSDLQAMRFLRDALIALDLGDDDETVVCVECEARFAPESDYYLCPGCALDAEFGA
jgi:hypothetical protein